MKTQDYHTSIMFDGTALEAFTAINSVTKWWTENLEGSSHKLNDEFTVHFGTTWKIFKVTEFVPGKKVMWLVTDCYLPWNVDKTEWKGTKISFEIAEKGSETKIHFTHIGLVPEVPCFDVCSNAWSEYIQGSLLNLIKTGKGQPARKEDKTMNKIKS